MSKKHFEKMASGLALVRPAEAAAAEYAQWQEDVEIVAQVCSEFNRSFDYARFVQACKER